MQTIIVVGHPYSSFRSIEETLCRCGMQPSRLSRIQNLTPQQIGEHLQNQIEDIPAAGGSVGQIIPGGLWDGLALDLYLANSDLPVWGWADSKALRLLDYWKSADPKIKFVLAYNAPDSAFAMAFAGQKPRDEEKSGFFREWCAYNSALLHFYHRNSSSCLLAHAEVFLSMPEQCVETVAAKLGIELSSKDALSGATSASFSSAALYRYLAKELLGECHQATAMYAELQASADFPLFIDDAPSPLSMWEEHVDLVEQTISARQAVQEMELALNNKGEQLRLAELQLATLEDAVRNAPQISSKKLEQENELLLTQLHLVQEELERSYLASKKGGVSVPAGVSIAKPAKKEQTGHYGAAARVKKQLSYRLGATMIAHSGSISGWLTLPIALARQVREFKSDREAAPQKLPPISTYRDAHDAERVRQHLSYRLGAVMLSNSRSPIGWVKMPFALRQELKSFKRSKQGK